MNAITEKVLVDSGLVNGERAQALGSRIMEIGKGILEGRMQWPKEPDNNGRRRINGMPP